MLKYVKDGKKVLKNYLAKKEATEESEKVRKARCM